MTEDPVPSESQIERFHRQIVGLVKKYQFRDRNQILGCGISVSQCYVLETLRSQGPLSVSELAAEMYLSDSTITRVVDQLVGKGYVTREESPQDRRRRVMDITSSGEDVYLESWKNVFESEKTILEHFPSEHREMLIDFLEMLNEAVAAWHGDGPS